MADDKDLVQDSGKSLLIEVPDWDPAADGNQTSYLRLGSFGSTDMSEDVRGADLLAAVTQVGPSDRWDDWEASPGPRVFEDDWRTRPPSELGEESTHWEKKRPKALGLGSAPSDDAATTAKKEALAKKLKELEGKRVALRGHENKAEEWRKAIREHPGWAQAQVASAQAAATAADSSASTTKGEIETLGTEIKTLAAALQTNRGGARKAWSSDLLSQTKPAAGWRDHTEGHRITTTRGDKLEVIGGNYKLVVLGRTGDPGAAAGFDLSGGLVQDFDAAPGTINEIRWVEDPYDGTWKIFEKTEKGIVHALYHGDVTEEFYGRNYKTIVGAPSPDKSAVEAAQREVDTAQAAYDAAQKAEEEAADADKDAKKAATKQKEAALKEKVKALRTAAAKLREHVPGDATDREMLTSGEVENPTIEERTWAKSISSYTGSATSPVPTITEETWAGSITSSTTVTGKISDSTKAGDIDENVHCLGQIRAMTMAANIAELTLAPKEELHVGAKTEMMVGPVVSVTLAPLLAELFLGFKRAMEIGRIKEFLIGSKDEFILKEGKFVLEEDNTAVDTASAAVTNNQTAVTANQTAVTNNQTAVSANLAGANVNVGGPPAAPATPPDPFDIL